VSGDDRAAEARAAGEAQGLSGDELDQWVAAALETVAEAERRISSSDARLRELADIRGRLGYLLGELHKLGQQPNWSGLLEMRLQMLGVALLGDEAALNLELSVESAKVAALTQLVDVVRG